jgi:BASS family bile acid:Na+ symporter
MGVEQLIVLAIKASIVLLVFGLGLHSTLREATYLFRHPGILARSVLSMNVVMLVFAIAIAALFDIHPALKIALVALAVSPVPPILPAKQTKAGGSTFYAIGLLVAAAVVAVLVVPIVIPLVGSLFGVPTRMPLFRVPPVVTVSIIAPLAAGILLRQLAPDFATRIARPISLLAAVLLVAAALPVIIVAWPQLRSMIGNGTLLVLALFTALGLVAGHLLGGPDPHHRTVLALASGTRHPGVALAIASVNSPDPKLVLAVVLWHLVVAAVVGIPYVRWRKRSYAAEIRATS